MIRNEKEYQEAVRRLQSERERIENHYKKLTDEMGLGVDEVKRAIDSMVSFYQQLAEEVESYERLKRGEFWEVTNFEGIGRLLIAIRIATGTTQRQLAERLGVSESQVSRDERNEYHRASVERVGRVLEALRAELRFIVTTVVVTPRFGSKVSPSPLIEGITDSNLSDAG